jgi:hypothetical protein
MVAALLAAVVAGGLLLAGRREGPATTAERSPGAPSTASSSPPARLAFSVAPSLVSAGESVVVAGRGCRPRAAMAISLGIGAPDPVIVTPPVRLDGGFSARVPVPTWARPGRYQLLVSCAAPGGGHHQAERRITVTG